MNSEITEPQGEQTAGYAPLTLAIDAALECGINEREITNLARRRGWKQRDETLDRESAIYSLVREAICDGVQNAKEAGWSSEEIFDCVWEICDNLSIPCKGDNSSGEQPLS